MKLHDLNINFYSIPDVEYIPRKESWISTIQSQFEFEQIDPGQINHLYCDNIESKLINLKEKIDGLKNVKTAKVVHETSYLGFPYKLLVEYADEEDTIKISYDGAIAFFTKTIKDEITDLQSLVSETSSKLGFRNKCLKISKELSIEIHWMPDPFWDVTYENIEDLGFKAEADYPVFKLTCNDERLFTITNLGDKRVHQQGRNYSIYFGKNKRSIRDRLCIDMLIYKDYESLERELKEANIQIIKSNAVILESLNGIPSNLLHIQRRFRNWKKLKHIPKGILGYESSFPKYIAYVEKLREFLNYRISYINVPFAICIAGEEYDEMERTQRDVDHFFEVKIDGEILLSVQEKAIKPMYHSFDDRLRLVLDEININLKTAKENMNNAISIFSTNFGFDAVIIAIIAVILPYIPCHGIYNLVRNSLFPVIFDLFQAITG